MPLTNEPALQELDNALQRLTLKDDKMDKVVTWVVSLESQQPQATTVHNPAGGNPSAPSISAESDAFSTAAWKSLLKRHGLADIEVAYALMDRLSTRAPIPPFVPLKPPCANADPASGIECPNPGLQVCSGCRLVKYCSKECQRKHWKLHSQDCKDPVRSEEWQPIWVQEGRPPTFVTGVPRMHPLSQGQQLWGTMPAVDILKLSSEELQAERDITLSFIASGDLRNVLKTVNGLPQWYSGKVTILLNDHNPFAVLRNILILQVLSTIDNKRKATDVALHLWYSAFIPSSYHAEFLRIGQDIGIGRGIFRSKMGPNAVLEADIDQEVRQLCCASLASAGVYGMGDAANELSRVRFDPHRADLRHRQWVRCKPSHRLALLEYNRFGLVLPFGAHNAHFNVPNRFLFTPSGEWLQTDGANPLNSWDIEEVVASGLAHGTTREDLYGCLYYHVVSQLEAFAERLAHMHVDIKITNVDALELAESLRSGDLAHIGVSPKTRFDRIDVSNLVDQDYLGIPRVLDVWGGLLKRDAGAAIVGHFMNWPGREPSAQPGDGDMRQIVDRIVSTGKITPPDRASARDMKTWMGSVTAMSHAFMAVHDHSAAFDTHLKKQGLDAALKKAGLKRRLQHRIVPHRLCGPLDGAPSALPEFEDNESWYLQSNVGAPMWTERYIEIVPA